MDSRKYHLLNTPPVSIEEMRYGVNELILPFLEKNELGKYFGQYPELKEMGFEGCKKKLSVNIEHILTEAQQSMKCSIHPSQSRSRYVQLQKWLLTNLQTLNQPQTFQQLSTLEYIEQQKKLIITTFLQLQSLFSSECKQKSEILRLIIGTSLQLVNTLLIELQNTSSNMLIGYLKEKNSSEKELIDRISSLEKTIEILEKEKNNKWKNLFIVVKDNRVLKKQNNKLIKMLNSEQEKVHILNEEHLKIKDENEKFKLLLSSDKDEQNTKLSRYVQAKIQINEIDRLIKIYPKQAQKIVYAELKNIEMTELDTLQQQIAHIVSAIENSGELIHQKDEGDDFLDSNKAKMCFNISIQTDKFTEDYGTNTYNKVLLAKQTQVCNSLKHNNFFIYSKNVSEQVWPFQRYQARSVEKKLTKPSMVNIKNIMCKESKHQSGRQCSIKDMASTKKVKWVDDFLNVRTVNFRYLPEHHQVPIIRKQTSSFRRFESLSSSSSSSNQKSDYNKNKQNKFKFQNTPNDKKNRDTSDSSIKLTQSKLKRMKSKQKKIAMFQNLHTFSSKSKVKDFCLAQSELWKISKTYNLSIKEQFKFCQNVFVSTFEDRSKLRKTSVMSGYSSSNNQKFFLTTFPGSLKAHQQEKYQDESDFVERMNKKENVSENKNISEVKVSEAVNKKVYRASKQKMLNVSLYMKKNLSKISNVWNEPKIPQKKSTLKNQMVRVNSKRRDRQQSQESVVSFGAANPIFDNRLSFQNDLPSEMPKNGLILRQVGNEEIVKRASQFSRPGVSSNILKAKKYNRQASVLLNRLKNPNMRLMTQIDGKRDSEFSFSSLTHNMKHMRTKTHGIDQIDETAEQQAVTTFKHLRGSVQKIKDLPMICKASEVQNEFEETLKPRNRFCLTTISDLQRIEQIDSLKCEHEEDAGAIDLVKSIERVVKNIAQRSVQIIKKEYLFKEFLLSFYQLQYGNGKQNIPKSYVQFLKKLRKSRCSGNPMVQCLNLLMNEMCSEVYRRDIFKLLAVLIDKNGGSLTDQAGEHHFYKKITTELLGIFIESTEVEAIVTPMCLDQLNGSLSDYFIAVEAEIRKRSINSDLYGFLAKNVLQFGDTTVSFEIIKEITFFMTHCNKRVKNQLIELRMYSDPFIDLHRLCLIVGRLKFNEFMQIESLMQKNYNEFVKVKGLDLSPKSMVNMLAKQKFDSFPYLKQVLHRQIECFYKYNSPISEPLLKLCQVNLFCQKLQNESPISDCLKAINEQCEKLERLKYYKQVLEDSSR